MAADRWTIDVCCTCGRLAVFPFCEHRDEPREDGRSWCMPVVVKPAYPGEYRATMARRRSEAAEVREARARERRGESIDPPSDPRRDDDVIIRG